MKKILLIIISTLMLILPITVKADNITTAAISGVTNTKVGESFTISVKIQFKDVFINNADSLGVFGVLAELDFNDKDFTITGISTGSAFDTEVLLTTDGKYYILSTLSDGYNTSKCYDKTLYCEEYVAELTFFTNNTTSKNSEIKLGNFTGFLLNMIENPEKELTENDLKLVTETGSGSSKHVINISSSSTSVETKASVAQSYNKDSSSVKNDIKNNINEKTNQTKEENNSSSNSQNSKYLKSLIVEGYDLNFDKYKNIYEIEVESDVNTLEITAEPENSKAKVEIIGRDNLKENNDKVIIKVTTDDDDEIKEYIVNVTRKEEEKEEVKEEKEESKIKLTDEQKNIATIVLISVVVLVLIIFIIVKIRDIRIEKGINKF